MTTYEIERNAMGYWDRTVVREDGTREYYSAVPRSEAEEWKAAREAADQRGN